MRIVISYWPYARDIDLKRAIVIVMHQFYIGDIIDGPRTIILYMIKNVEAPLE